MYGVRFGGGAGASQGVLPGKAYGKILDFFSSLDILTSRNNTVAFNLLENVVRDSCDAGAFESWGVGVGNNYHTNAISDCDSGGVDGSWMNFLFQDDASHWMNMSSNILFNVAGKGSEEAGMIKSIHSVFENNVVAYSELGHALNAQPYIEPAASMTFARNVFAFLTTTDDFQMDISVNQYTSATLQQSCSIMTGGGALAAAYNFTNTTTPSLHDPVVLELDHNLYWQTGHNLSQLAAWGWDRNAIAVDPLFVAPAVNPWERTVSDLVLRPESPAYSLPGFRRIAVEKIGLDQAFQWDLSLWARRVGPLQESVQAETYDRQQGLWREGSYAISPGQNNWPFLPGAWALYRRCDIKGATVFQIRIQPLSTTRTVSLALNTPTNILATFSAQASAAPADVMAIYNVTLSAPLTVVGGDLFLLPSGGCVIDWFRLLDQVPL